ncbi:hypothetical protein [Nocardia sp. NRRL S-836]|uniref:hypothetical protein n=1 Tax=Nocardia sp. NRRL S-836 TaxID=1519492 RepID=UPI0006AED713|nr:hypothetical protein [Nocardia sp. NRRL S-836]KOV89055.1 hypothetical protein ADL03_03725 [Nocardia sp. NRRL S-836]
MKTLPVQRFALGVAVLNALLVVATFLPGAPLLPTWVAIGCLVLAGVAVVVMVMGVRRVRLRVDGIGGLFRAVRETLPRWAVVLAAVAFYGGWGLGFVMLATETKGNLKYENGEYTTTQRRTVTVLTEEQYLRATNANQRAAASTALAVATGVFVLAGLAQRLRQQA